VTATGPRGTVTGCNAGNSGPAYATRWSRLGLRGVRQRPAHNPQVASISRAYPAHCRTTGQPQHTARAASRSASDKSSPVNSAGSRSRHPAWATQSVALLRPWFIGTRSACATGTTSKPPPHRIDSRLPAAGVKPVPTRRGRYSAAPTPDPKPEPTCTVRASAGRCTPLAALCARTRGHRAENRGQLVDLQVRGLLGRRHPRTAQQLRRAPGRTANARPGTRTRDMGSGPQLRYTAVTATCSETRRSRLRSGLLVGPAQKRDSGTVRPRGQSRLQGGPCRRLDSAPGPVQCARRRLARSAAGRSCPDLGLVGTPWDRDSPGATAAEEAAPCRDTSRNVVRRQTAAYGAEPNTHPEGSR